MMYPWEALDCTFSDIYERCNAAVLEPRGYWDAKDDPKWRDAMPKDLKGVCYFLPTVWPSL